jgi:hypothetical protein
LLLQGRHVFGVVRTSERQSLVVMGLLLIKKFLVVLAREFRGVVKFLMQRLHVAREPLANRWDEQHRSDGVQKGLDYCFRPIAPKARNEIREP